VFGAGGGTSSYREIETADLVILWGSNARETHPIFFHHLLKGIHNGARLIVIDPRRTSSAQWADLWLGIEVGSDIALANAIGHEIISAKLVNVAFVRNATSGYDDYLRCVEAYPPERAESLTGIPAGVIREVARSFAQAGRAQICWTLGITEHHNAVDNVLALINLALLTGHVGRDGSGLNPLRGQNNVQGGGDMGAIPNRLTGFQDLEDDAVRSRFEAAWDCVIPPRRGLHLSQMFDAMEGGKLSSLLVVGENPAQSEADQGRALRLLGGLRHLVVQDIYLTRTAEMADVVLPASASWSESEGTVTNSERRVQRSRRALEPPPGARDDIAILAQLAGRLGRDWGVGSAEAVWDEVRMLSPMHAGMTYARLEALGGIQWPCPTEDHPGTPTLHTRLWTWPLEGPPAPFSAVEHEPPVDELSPEFPIRLTTGRRLDSFNTGVQSGRFPSPLRRGESIDLHPADAARLGVAEGEPVRVVSRRGAVEAPVRLDPGLRPGLAFMTLHFPDEVPTNQLTIDTYDPKSGTAEFKATAIRVERIGAGAPA
jgi:formate dehydrogenase major subunit